MKKKIFIIILLLYGSIFGQINSQILMNPVDKRWVSMGELSGADGEINAITVKGYYLYAAGSFSGIKNIRAHSIARLHIPSNTWNALGEDVEGRIFDVAVDSKDNIYIAGWFAIGDNEYGESEFDYILKWNGSKWESLPSRLDEIVYALEIDDFDNLYAGGRFTKAGGLPVNNIAKWDGTKWSKLAEGTENEVYKMIYDGKGNLYVLEGEMPYYGGEQPIRLSKWNMTEWNQVDGDTVSVNDFTVDKEGDLYIYAGFKEENYWRYKIAEWNGSDWTIIKDDLEGSGVKTLVTDSSGNLFAGGSFSFEKDRDKIIKWNGSEWMDVGLWDNGDIRLMTVDLTDSIYVLNDSFNISVWNKEEWQKPSGRGFNNPVLSLVVDASGILYAGGGFSKYNDEPLNCVAMFDSDKWTSIGEPSNCTASRLLLDEDGNLYAVKQDENTNYYYIAMWNGTVWNSLPEGVTGNIISIAIDNSGNLYAGGVFTQAGEIEVSNIAKWNGTEWSPLGNGLNGAVNVITFDPSGTLYAGGKFTKSGEVETNLIAKWNGTEWSSIGNGFSSYSPEEDYSEVNAILFDHDGNIYAGGSFEKTGESNLLGLGMWNGTEWTELGNGFEGYVYDLTFDTSGNLYASGEMWGEKRDLFHNIAKWDGVSWSNLGSGIDGSTYDSAITIVVDNEQNLYAGGFFSIAGNKVSPYIAKYVINGDIGNTGNTGNTGDTGDTGNTGNTGDTDDTGNTGDTEYSGDIDNNYPDNKTNEDENDSDYTDSEIQDNSNNTSSGCGCSLI